MHFRPVSRRMSGETTKEPWGSKTEFEICRRSRLSHHSRVSKRVAARLRPNSEAVGLGSDRDRFHCAAGRIDRIDDSIEAAGEPKKFAIGADVSHVGTAATGN